jgi:hypothetical protein
VSDPLSLIDPVLKLDGDARRFSLSGRLPRLLAQAQRRAEEQGHTPTEIWQGFTIGSAEAMPDHVLVVASANFNRDGDELLLHGRIEGPLPT